MIETNDSFVRPDGCETGVFDSWEVISDYIALKNTDLDFYKNHESGIPKGIRWFFKIETLQNNEKLKVVLIFEKQEYEASIRIISGRSRINWHVDLGKKLNEASIEKQKAILVFVRVSNNCYSIKLLDKSEILAADDSTIENKEKHAAAISDEALWIAAVKHGRIQPEVVNVGIKQIYRDPYIAENAKRIAKGYCQLCKQAAPFCDSKERPYLEAHHIDWVSNGGADVIENVVALCPNCHRKMHILNDEKDVEQLRRLTHYYNRFNDKK